MTKLIGMLFIIFLLLFWLIYRETRHHQKHKNKTVKPNRKFTNAQHLLRNNHEKPSSPHVKSTPTDPINSLTSMPPAPLTELQIIKPGMIDEETFAYATKIIDSIQRPHPALQSLTENITTEALIDIMHGCPDITAKILTTVNSASFGLLVPITSINHAIIYLGIGIVKSITLQLIIKESLGKTTSSQKKAYKQLWSASYINSSLSFLMAQSLSNPLAAELSTKALLDSVGCFALLSFDETFAETYLTEPSLFKRTIIEQEKYGLNASVIGYFLAKKWQLPTVMTNSISHNFFVLQYKKKPIEMPLTEKKNLVFCYLMGRISNEIVYNKLRDFNHFRLEHCHDLDYFYLQEALSDTQLDTCITMMKTPSFIKKINRIIKQAV